MAFIEALWRSRQLRLDVDKVLLIPIAAEAWVSLESGCYPDSMLLLCAFEGCLVHLSSLKVSICMQVLKKIFYFPYSACCYSVMFKYKEKIDLTWPVEAVMQYTMVLIKGIQLV